MPRLSIVVRLFFVAIAAAVAIGPVAQADSAAPGRYIIRLKPSVADPNAAAQDLAGKLGFQTDQVYRTVIKGFAAQLPQAAVNRLRGDPRVASIEADREVKLSADREPTGIDRVGADIGGNLPTQPGVPVAVIDSGIDLEHPDLNVVGGYNCTAPRTDVQKRRTDYDDYIGHGTHVAGTIGAKDNGSFVVGVAPGTPLYAVRVFRQWAVGAFDSQVICGMDWVAENAAAKNIKVANMSLGGPASADDQKPCGGGTTAFHEAVCGLVRAGVTVVVAAGNESDNANNHSPATYPEVITVSALADSDGCTGGKGPDIEGRLGTYHDDTRALFSNFGADVDVAAPGLEILSTVPKSETRYAQPSGLDKYSGTSMAAPHVAGAIALNIKQGRGATYAEERGVLPEGVLKVSNAIQCGD